MRTNLTRSARSRLRVSFGRFRRDRLLLIVPLLVLVVLIATLDAANRSPVKPEPADPKPMKAAAKFVPLEPVRVLDTRIELPGPGTLAAGGGLTLPLIDRVPADAVAVVLTVTVTNSAGAGFLTVWPSGSSRPVVSSVNTTYRDQTVANLVTVAIGDGGSIDMYSLTGSDVVADLSGYYLTSGPTADGRLVTVQTRAIDTRSSRSRIAAGGSIVVDLAEVLARDDLSTVTATGAIAVVVNVTAVNAPVGFWSAFPTTVTRPTVSNLNVDVAGRVTASMAIVPIVDGRFRLFSQNGGDVVVDILGYFTGPDTEVGSDGLFVPVDPTRLLDTRSTGTKPARGGRVDVSVEDLVASYGYFFENVAAIDVNATVTEASAEGFFTLYPGRYPIMPELSNLNAPTAGATVANHAMTPLSPGGLSFFTQNGAHLLVDVTGFFTGPVEVCYGCYPTRAPQPGTRSDWYPATPATIGAAWTTAQPVMFSPDAAVFVLSDGVLIVGLYQETWIAYFAPGAVTFEDLPSRWNHYIQPKCADGTVTFTTWIKTDYNEEMHPYYQGWAKLRTLPACP